MTDHTRALLRDIEDAHTELRHYRIVFGLLMAAFVVFAVAGLSGALMGVWSAGTGHDYSGPAAVGIFAGIIGICVTGGFISWWWRLHHFEDKFNDKGDYKGEFYAGHPRRKVVAAHRAHEDHVLAVANEETP
jgi:hypothetical protein